VIVATTIGGTSGVIRFFAVQRNPFSVVHPLLDTVVIALLVSRLIATARRTRPS
jgi:hypothetical protein